MLVYEKIHKVLEYFVVKQHVWTTWIDNVSGRDSFSDGFIAATTAIVHQKMTHLLWAPDHQYSPAE